MAKDSIAVVVHPKHMPMLIPPRPWKAHDDGAYLFHKGKPRHLRIVLDIVADQSWTSSLGYAIQGECRTG